MYMTKETIRQWRRGIGIPAVALILCAALFVGCSRDDGQEPDGGDPVALSFTAAVDGVAFAHLRGYAALPMRLQPVRRQAAMSGCKTIK